MAQEPNTIPVLYGCGHTKNVTTQMPFKLAQEQLGKVDCPDCVAAQEQ